MAATVSTLLKIRRMFARDLVPRQTTVAAMYFDRYIIPSETTPAVITIDSRKKWKAAVAVEAIIVTLGTNNLKNAVRLLINDKAKN